MSNKKEKKPSVKRKIVIIASIFLALTFLSTVLIIEFYYDPVRIMYHYTFDNGTRKWVEADVIVYHDFKNGTVFGTYVGDMIQELKLESSIQKVIHLKDGTIDYYYKHNDFIGSKTP